MLENGRLAASFLTNTGAAYAHPFVQAETVTELSGHVDELGRFVFIPHATTDPFFSMYEGDIRGTFEYDAIHGEILTVFVTGGLSIFFYNTEQDVGGPWDQLQPAGMAGEEKIVWPGLFLNPADGDVSGGNLSYQAY